MKASWNDVEKELLERVFYAHDDASVRDADDLAKEGMLDSLSIVAVLEIMVESSGDEDALTKATATDFRNLSSIRAFYQNL